MARVRKDSGWKKQIRNLIGMKTVTVGIHQADNARPDALTNAQIGAWQEFGTDTIPARSFIRAPYEKAEREGRVKATSAMAAIARGKMTPDRALSLIGMFFKAKMQQAIRANIPPALADSTIAAKGSSTPLIDTGQLLRSIDYEVKT